jgi:hypothetical protein
VKRSINQKITCELINRLAKLIKITPAQVIDTAVYNLAVTYRLAGVGASWEAEAKRRGYREMSVAEAAREVLRRRRERGVE